MMSFDISHPDVIDVIKAKRTDGMLRNFNISLLITDDFIQKVKNDKMWEFTWKGKPFVDAYGKETKSIKARELYDIIMKSTYDYAEPGFLLIDRINQYNNLWFDENIRTSNP